MKVSFVHSASGTAINKAEAAFFLFIYYSDAYLIVLVTLRIVQYSSWPQGGKLDSLLANCHIIPQCLYLLILTLTTELKHINTKVHKSLITSVK